MRVFFWNNMVFLSASDIWSLTVGSARPWPLDGEQQPDQAQGTAVLALRVAGVLVCCVAQGSAAQSVETRPDHFLEDFPAGLSGQKRSVEGVHRDRFELCEVLTPAAKFRHESAFS